MSQRNASRFRRGGCRGAAGDEARVLCCVDLLQRISHVRSAVLAVLLGAMGSATAMGADGVIRMQQDAWESADPYLWLEDIHGAKPMEWVKTQNTRATAVLQADPDYQKDYDAILRVMDATDRIPYGELDHQYVFNYWQDASHPKGVWRRASIEDYRKSTPQWDSLLDLDRLAADEHENWVWKGADCTPSLKRCL